MVEVTNKNRRHWTAKDCALIGVMVTLLIVAQVTLSALSGVELVTVLLASFAYCFGVRRGVLTALLFSLLRQFIFGVFPNVLCLYLVYFSFLALVFGLIGHRGGHRRGILVLVASLCTVCFTLLDNVLTPLWYGYSMEATKVYFYASFTTLVPHVICVAVTVGVLFVPLCRLFAFARRD